MGLSFRKSIRVGPLRFNLSKSGIGVSTGIPGFRVGTGPRGSHVSAGRGGITFRKNLASSAERTPSTSGGGTGESQPQRSSLPADRFVVHDSADVSVMVDSGAEELLQEMNTKAGLKRFLLIGLSVMILLSAVLAISSLPKWIWFIFAPVFVGSLIWLHWVDQVRKTTVVMYDLDATLEAAYETLLGALGSLRLAGKVSNVSAVASLQAGYERKVNAGATALMKSERVRPRTGSPEYIRTNVDLFLLPAGNQTLCFMPDRMLVVDDRRVGAVPYDEIRVAWKIQKIIENEGVPRDAQVVGSTWKYPNKNGGPDLRYKDNPEIPIAAYEELTLTSRSGLNEVFQISLHGASRQLELAINAMALALQTHGGDQGSSQCSCYHCGEVVEYASQAAGQTATCPHCSQDIQLPGGH